jgi:lipoprotein-anchoring transpeptidase ErfK/SrfK/peptidoglycan hydrolase-like protein with peptidoglycan-binding domain
VLPKGEVHAAAPAAGRLAEASDALVAEVRVQPLDTPQAGVVSALAADGPLPNLYLATDRYLDLPVAQAAVIRAASRVDTLAPVFPKRTARAIEIAALPGETMPGTTPPVAPVAAESPEPLLLAISLLDQKLNVYRGLELIVTTKVSSGARGYETRTGVFSILEKKRYHHSNLYSNAPMPWMQRLTRSGTALHAGVVPNYPASHGCIRLPFSFAPELFKITEVGANVVVAGHMPEPGMIEHPVLFQPAAAQPDATASDEEAPPPLRMLVTRRNDRDKLISVQERLAELGYLAPQKFTGRRGGATNAAIKEFQKANGLPATGEITDDLVKSVHEAAGKPAPPEGHLFVRRGFKRLFDVPVSVSNPAAPFGTFAFTAMHFAPGDAKASWAAMTVEGGDASAALDRIEIPVEARERISELLTPGATFIIAETSKHSAILPEGDDFIISATEVPSSGPKIAAASPAPSNLKRVKKSRAAVKRRTARHYYYPQYRARRGLFFRW